MKILFPLIALLVAVGVFFGYTSPAYQEVKKLKATEAQYDDALARSRDLIALRDRLQETFKAIPPDDLAALTKLLPDHIDNIRLLLDLTKMAEQYGMRLSGANLGAPPAGGQSLSASGKRYDSVTVGFSVAASYETFKQFLHDLESSLRLLDVVGLSFTPSAQGNLYEFTLNVRTYWLK